MHNLVGLLQGLILQWGSLGYFIGTLLEEVIIPLPSSLIMMAGGFFLISASSWGGALAQVLTKLVPLGTAGVLLGSLFLYTLTYFGEEVLIKRLGRYLGVSWQEVENIQKYFSRGYSDEITILVLRAIPIFPGALTSILAGFIRMPVGRFILFGGIGTALRVLIMGILGWYTKELYVFYAAKFEAWSNVFTLIFVFLAVVGYFWLKKKVGKII